MYLIQIKCVLQIMSVFVVVFLVALVAMVSAKVTCGEFQIADVLS